LASASLLFCSFCFVFDDCVPDEMPIVDAHRVLLDFHRRRVVGLLQNVSIILEKVRVVCLRNSLAQIVSCGARLVAVSVLSGTLLYLESHLLVSGELMTNSICGVSYP